MKGQVTLPTLSVYHNNTTAKRDPALTSEQQAQNERQNPLGEGGLGGYIHMGMRGRDLETPAVPVVYFNKEMASNSAFTWLPALIGGKFCAVSGLTKGGKGSNV